MSPEPLRLIVLARDQSPRVQDAWTELSGVLDGHNGIELVATAVTEDLPEDIPDADLVVVLGGDGALLRACRQLGQDQKPILGVNLGRLGFLADLSPGEFREKLSQIRNREYHVVEYLMFECEHVDRDGNSERMLGLNETAILVGAGPGMLDVQLEIDGESVTTYRGDGVIVSTPVGSTAHSLSAGGPILRQDLQAFVVTPICPHALTNRPLVDRADREYSLTVTDGPDGVMLVVDGQVRRPMAIGEVVHVRRAEGALKLAPLPGHSYYPRLRNKLGWSGQTPPSAE